MQDLLSTINVHLINMHLLLVTSRSTIENNLTSHVFDQLYIILLQPIEYELTCQ